MKPANRDETEVNEMILVKYDGERRRKNETEDC